MPALTPFASAAPPHLKLISPRRSLPLTQPICRIKCQALRDEKSLEDETESGSENLVLKAAWYSSELLGIAVSALNSKAAGMVEETPAFVGGNSLAVDRDTVVKYIKDDFQRSYFVTGDLTLNAYQDDCEFADPAGSFRGLQRFRRNCRNFGSLIEKSNMKLTRWQDFEDKGIGHWRFSCVMAFPWRPILSATGYTEYFFDEETGKVCRHVEHWNVPKMTLLKQLLKPTRPFLFWGHGSLKNKNTQGL